MFVRPFPRDDDADEVDPQVGSPQATVNAAFAGLFLETLLFGALLVVYSTGTWKVLSRKWSFGSWLTRRDWILVAANTLMFVFATVHISLDVHIAVASGMMRGAGLQSVSHALARLNSINSLGASKTGLVVAQMMIGDAFMVYRAYIVWNRLWRIIAIPAFLLVLEVLLGFISVSLGLYGIQPDRIQASLGAYFVVTAATNVFSTALVVKPILFPRRTVQDFESDSTGTNIVAALRWRVVASIVHSAALFTVSSVLFAVTFFASPLGFFVCHTIFLSGVAIVFSLTITRMCLRTLSSRLSVLALDADFAPARASMPVSMLSGPSVSSSAPLNPHAQSHVSFGDVPSLSQLPSREQDRRRRDSQPLSPIAVHVSVTTTCMSDGADHEDSASVSSSEDVGDGLAKEQRKLVDGGGKAELGKHILEDRPWE